MVDSVTHRKKRNQLLRIKDFCKVKEAKEHSDNDYDPIQIVLGIMMCAIILACILIPSVITFIIVGFILLVFVLFIYPKIKKNRKSIDEKIYTSVYAYESPLPDKIKRSNEYHLAKSLKSSLHEDYKYITIWANMEIEGIDKILLHRSKEGLIREMIVERGDNEE